VQSKGYVAGQGKLADSHLYREAMAGTPSAPTGALYLDVQKLTDTEQLRPVKAISFAAGRDGGDIVGVGRIIIK